MGKKLDFLLRRNFKTSKYKSLVHTLSTRIAILEKKHRLQWLQSQSDVIELLKLGQQERALLRVEHVVMEQNMLDAFAMIEGYCNIVVERIMLIENNKECAIELKEAIASLIFAASRCGELPELQKIRSLFTDRFGKELALRAVELRNNCGVSPKMVKKLSARRPSLESKLKVLKEIALGNGISLRLGRNPSSVSTESTNQKLQGAGESDNVDNPELQHVLHHSANEQKQDKKAKEKVGGRKKYRDVRTAAQAAYELAADAAEAAFAAMKLSHPGEKDHDNQTKPTKKKYASNSEESSKCLQLIALDDKQYQKNREAAHEETQSKIMLWPSSEDEKIESNKNVTYPKEGSSSLQSVSSSSWEREIFREILRQNRQLRVEKGSNKNDGENTMAENKSVQKDSNPENKSELPITPNKQGSHSEGESSHSEITSREISADIRVSSMGRRPTLNRSRRLLTR